ncbi:MAG: hypothetical protein JNL17_10645 [Cyclobacteriaceae bacterium]|nr:hypothetical protein [Cyclobacteriaceae bacterium]
MASKLVIKPVEELFKEFVKNRPFVDADMVEWEECLSQALNSDNANRDESREKIRWALDTNLGYGAGSSPYDFYFIWSHRFFGVNLNQQFEVPKDDPQFPLLFGYRLATTQHPVEFLDFHFKVTFKGSQSKLRLLLAQLDDKVLGSRMRLLEEWASQHLKRTKSSFKHKKKLLDFTGDVEKALKGELGEYPSKTKLQRVAKTLMIVCERKEIKINGAAIARYFHSIKAKPSLALRSLQDYFKKAPLSSTEPIPHLKESLLNKI